MKHRFLIPLALVPCIFFYLLAAGCASTSQDQDAGASADAEPAFTPWPNLTTAQARDLTKSRLTKLTSAVLLYAHKNGEDLPDLSTPDTLRTAVTPYLSNGDTSVFLNPTTGASFLGNASLAGMNLGDNSFKWALMPLLYDAPDLQGQRCVVFADGHFEAVPETQWATIKKNARAHDPLNNPVPTPSASHPKTKTTQPNSSPIPFD